MRLVSGKCGPDYIDRMFHREVLKIDAQNLDLFYDKEHLENYLYNIVKTPRWLCWKVLWDFCDGMGIDTDKGSYFMTWRKLLKTPVALVVSCKGSALSIYYILKGLIEFKKDSNIQGFLLNQVSEMLYPSEHELRRRD